MHIMKINSWMSLFSMSNNKDTKSNNTLLHLKQELDSGAETKQNHIYYFFLMYRFEVGIHSQGKCPVLKYFCKLWTIEQVSYWKLKFPVWINIKFVTNCNSYWLWLTIFNVKPKCIFTLLHFTQACAICHWGMICSPWHYHITLEKTNLMVWANF